MNNKIKIFLILGIIILFLIFLIIRKQKKNLLNNFIFNKNLKNVVEKFETSCDEITDDMYCINLSDENKKTKFLGIV